MYLLIISLLIILFLFYLCFRSSSPSNSYLRFRHNQTHDTIQSLYQICNNICYHCNFNPIYTILESSHITYTDSSSYNTSKGTIHLVIWNTKYSRSFDRNTLLFFLLRELSLIISPSSDNSSSINAILLNTAVNLGYFDPLIPIDPDYRF
jgi:hypothetical protein